jgi:hypothetical protein
MKGQVLVAIDDKDIRFTPDGKVAALDAIGALSERLPAELAWEGFRSDNPDIACEEYTFPGDETLCVIDRRTMERVEDWLFAYTLENL